MTATAVSDGRLREILDDIAPHDTVYFGSPPEVRAIVSDLLALREAADEARIAISYAMRGTSDADQSDKYAATIDRLSIALNGGSHV